MEQQNQQTQPPVFNQPQAPQPAPQYQPQVTASPMMDPVTAVKTCFKKYFYFKGRARRSEFWWFALFGFIVSSVLSFICGFLLNTSYGGLVMIISYLSFAFSLAMFIPMLSAFTRRLHDINRSGWWIALMALCMLGYYGCFAYLLGPNLELMTNMTDPMGMAKTLVESIQSSPVVSTVMYGCSFGALILFVVNIIFAFIDSKWGVNKYGPSPKYQ